MIFIFFNTAADEGALRPFSITNIFSSTSQFMLTIACKILIVKINRTSSLFYAQFNFLYWNLFSICDVRI